MRKEREIPSVVGYGALGRLWGVSRQRAHQIVHREQHRARQNVAKALEGGQLVKALECEICGRGSRRLEAHHDDYSQALKVRWLCVACHLLIHPHLRRPSEALNGERKAYPPLRSKGEGSKGVLDRKSTRLNSSHSQIS